MRIVTGVPHTFEVCGLNQVRPALPRKVQVIMGSSEFRHHSQGDPVSRIETRELQAPTLEELRRLRASLPGEALSTPFQTPEFLHAFQETQCADGDRTLSVVAFAADETSGRPFMLLPLLRYRRGPVRIVSIPDLNLADQTAPVLSSGFLLPPAEAGALISGFLAGIEDADLIDIHKMHPTVQGVPNPIFALPFGHRDGTDLQIELTETADGTAWWKKSIYKKARSKFRRLENEGVRFTEAGTAEDNLSIYWALAAQRKNRFRDLDRDDNLQEDGCSSFYETLASTKGADMPFRAFALRRGTEVVGALAVLVSGTEATAVLISIGASRWHHLSPGMVLFTKAIEWAAGHGIRHFNFGTGQQLYKQRFGGRELQSRRLMMPLNARGAMFVRAWEAKRTAMELFQIALGRK